MKQSFIIRYLAIFSLMGIALLMWTCQKSELDLANVNTEIQLKGSIASPVVFGKLSIEDILNQFDEEETIEKFEDSLLYIAFSDTILSLTSDDIGEDIPDQGFTEEYIEAEIAVNPAWIASNVGDTVNFQKIKEEEWTFDNNERIDSVHIKSLDLVIEVNSTFKHRGILDITTDNFTIDGSSFEHEVMISDVTGNFSYTQVINLDDHWLYLDNETPGQTKIILNYDLNLINSGNPVLAGEYCRITMSFEGLEFYSVFGYIGQYDLADIEEDTIEFDFFDDESLDMDIFLADPVFNLTIDNSVGVPIGIDLASLTANSVSKGTSLNFQLDENPYTIGGHGLDSIGYFKRTEISINNSNSNITDILASLPNQIIYTVGANTNPSGTETDNFVTDSSAMYITMEAIVPFYLRVKGFTLEDTTEFDFEDQFGDVSDIIKLIQFDLDVVNRIPLDVNMQIFFTDENYTILDSLFVDDAFLVGPALNDQDEVDTPNEYTKSEQLNDEKLQKIRPSKYLIIRGDVSTAKASEDKLVKFYSYYDIDFKLKLLVEFDGNSSQLEDAGNR